MASVGHVRDLPRSGLGVDVDDNFKPKYVIPRDKSKIVTGLRKAASTADEVWLATDPDREGEAIAWHLQTAAKLDGKPVRRIAFHEITESAVRDAVANPREIDQNLVDAQQARRVLDRLVGYQISPLLNRRVQRGTSAGRVQSVALRMLVERDREIDAFEPQEFWTIDGLFVQPDTEHPQAIARLAAEDGDLEIVSEKTASEWVDRLKGSRFFVESIRAQTQQRRPAPPFTTSTMQQAASAQLRMSPRRTMALAQQLYEGAATDAGRTGLITYMRTDSTSVSADAQGEARGWVSRAFDDSYLPDQPPSYSSRVKNAQEAHEAVRPTSVTRTPDDLRDHLDRDQLRLYELIWRRFVASQMVPARLRRHTAIVRPVHDGEEISVVFRANATQVEFAGHFAVSRPDREEDPAVTEAATLLRQVAEGDPLSLFEITPEQHFTEPPPRYTEATLIRRLEEEGIGRPSTYAPTIGTLIDRQYATSERSRISSTELGRTVSDLLIEHFRTIVNYDFTARMEEDLDSVSRGELGWVPVLQEFYTDFAKLLKDAEQNMKVERPPDEPAGRDCPLCSQPLLYKHGRFGRFVGCTGFPQCRHTEAILVKTGVVCPKCNDGELVERKTRRGRTFWGCQQYPKCDHATWQNPKTPADKQTEATAADA
jgi:DNA topoisomerase-1